MPYKDILYKYQHQKLILDIYYRTLYICIVKKKKPDLVVFDEKDGYNASVLPYGTNVSAPSIKMDDVVTWKQQGVIKVNHELKTKFYELKEEYTKFVEEFKWNELVYNSKFNFEPVIGESYHLFVGDDGEMFLSLIEPQFWKKREHIASFQLNSERKWVKI